ncbi:MAG: class I SAM-dependent methyltransferase [Rhizobiaceae bacterium]
MNQCIFEKIGSHYDDLVARYGHSSSACDYGHPASQAAKFAVLSEVMPLDGKSLLDVGCGFADYADYLLAKQSGLDYEGIDLSQAMVAEAQRLHPNLRILQGNILIDWIDTYDVVSANGIFYLLGSDAPAIMRRIIEQMFNSARLAIAFNSLSDWTTDKEPNEYYADPLEVFDYCRTITPWVILRTDYHHRDFTIYMYKERKVL